MLYFTNLLPNLCLIQKSYSSFDKSSLIQIHFAEDLKSANAIPYIFSTLSILLSYYSHLFPLLWLMILCDCGAEWWWNSSIVHHIYGWPRFGCWGPRGSSRKEIAAGYGSCTNRTAQALSLSFTYHHQLQAASWRGSLQSRSEC